MEDWDAWRELILDDLRRLNKNIEELNERMNKNHILLWKEVVTLKVKASFWGIIGGSIIGIPAIIILLINKFF